MISSRPLDKAGLSCYIKAMKGIGLKAIFAALILLLSSGLAWEQDLADMHYFEWEPFRTDSFLFQAAKEKEIFPLPDTAFQDSEQYQFYLNGNGHTTSSSDRTEGLELDFHRFKFSISRYTLDLDHDRTIRKSDLDREREKLIQSFPSSLRSSSIQDRFESIGKIFEPKINLRIEF